MPLEFPLIATVSERYVSIYATLGLAGIDLKACIDKENKPSKGSNFTQVSENKVLLGPNGWVLLKVRFSARLLDGTTGMICSKSGLVLKHGITVANAPGIID